MRKTRRRVKRNDGFSPDWEGETCDDYEDDENVWPDRFKEETKDRNMIKTSQNGLGHLQSEEVCSRKNSRAIFMRAGLRPKLTDIRLDCTRSIMRKPGFYEHVKQTGKPLEWTERYRFNRRLPHFRKSAKPGQFKRR